MFIYGHHYTGYRALQMGLTHNYPNIMDIQHKISTTYAVDKIKSYIFLRAQGKTKTLAMLLREMPYTTEAQLDLIGYKS